MIPLLSAPADPMAVAAPDARPAGSRPQSVSDAELIHPTRPGGSLQAPSDSAGRGEGDFVGILLALAGEATRTTEEAPVQTAEGDLSGPPLPDGAPAAASWDPGKPPDPSPAFLALVLSALSPVPVAPAPHAGALGERSEAGIVQQPAGTPAQRAWAGLAMASPGPSIPPGRDSGQTQERASPVVRMAGPSIPPGRDSGQAGVVEQQQEANQAGGQALALDALSGVPASLLASLARVPAEAATGATGLAGQPAAHAGASVPVSGETTPPPSGRAFLATAEGSAHGEEERAGTLIPRGEARVVSADVDPPTPGQESRGGEAQRAAAGRRRTEVPRNGLAVSAPPPADPEANASKGATAAEVFEVVPTLPQVVRASQPLSAEPSASGSIELAEGSVEPRRVFAESFDRLTIPSEVEGPRRDAQAGTSSGEAAEGLRRVAPSADPILPQVVRAIRQAAAAQGAPVRLQVESLGEIQVHVEGGLRTLRLEATTPATQASLERTLPALRAALREEGLPLDRLQVGVRLERSAGGETPALGRAMGASASSWIAAGNSNGSEGGEPERVVSESPRRVGDDSSAPYDRMVVRVRERMPLSTDSLEASGREGAPAPVATGGALILPQVVRASQAGGAEVSDEAAEGLRRVAPSAEPPVPQIARAIRQAAAEQGAPVRLQVESLGEIQVQVRWKGGLVTARLEAATPAAQEILARALPALRAALREEGLPLDRLQVGLRLDVGARPETPAGARVAADAALGATGHVGRPTAKGMAGVPPSGEAMPRPPSQASLGTAKGSAHGEEEPAGTLVPRSEAQVLPADVDPPTPGQEPRGVEAQSAAAGTRRTEVPRNEPAVGVMAVQGSSRIRFSSPPPARPEVSTGKVAPATETLEGALTLPQVVRASQAPSTEHRAPSTEPLIPQIVRAIRQAAPEQGAPVRLQVESLGEVQVQVRWKGGLVTARLEAATPAAQEILERGLPTLRAALLEQGVPVDRLQVGLRLERSARGEAPALGRAAGASASSRLTSASGNGGGGGAEMVAADGPFPSAPPVNPSGQPRSGEPGWGAPAPVPAAGSGLLDRPAAEGSDADPDRGNGGTTSGRGGTRGVEPAAQRRAEEGDDVAEPARVTSEKISVPLGLSRGPLLEPTVGPPGEAATIQQVVRAIRQAATHGGMEVRLRLHPESLGEVQVQVRWKGGLVTARLEAATPAAQEILELGLPTLRAALLEQGVPVDRLQVGLRLDLGPRSENPDLGRATGGPPVPLPVPAGVAPETAEVIALPTGRLDIRI